MNKKFFIALIVVLLVAIAGGLVYYFQGGNLQGLIFRKGVAITSPAKIETRLLDKNIAQIAPPTLVSPEDGVIYRDANPDLYITFRTAPGTTSYDLQAAFGSNQRFISINKFTIPDSQLGQVNTYTDTIYSTNFPPLDQDYIHRWKVVAYDSKGKFVDSEIRTIKIYQKVSTSVFKSPFDEERFLKIENVSFDASNLVAKKIIIPNIKWSSSIDGNLGIGQKISKSNLSVGYHEIIATNGRAVWKIHIRVFDNLSDLYLAKPSQAEVDRLMKEFNFLWPSENNEEWSSDFKFDQTSPDPSKIVALAKIDLLRHQIFSESIPFTNGDTIYNYFRKNVKSIVLRLGCGMNQALGNGTIMLFRLASVWDGRSSDDCTNPSINPISIYPYNYFLQLLIHESRHLQFTDPGHVTCEGSNAIQYGNDQFFESGSGYAYGALYDMWVYKKSLSDTNDIKQNAKSEAVSLLKERFCMKPTHSNPNVQEIIDELLP